MKATHLLIWLLLLTPSLKGQTFRQYLRVAENNFMEKNYYSAMKYFEIAHEIEEADMEVLYKYAESARLFGAYTFADTAYSKVLASPEASGFPMAVYWLAKVKKLTGQYASAQSLFQKYLELNSGTDDEFVRSAKKELEACDWAIEVINEPDEHVTLSQMSASVNTPYSEFGAIRVGETTYYSSYSFPKEDDKDYPPRQYVKVLKSTDGGETVEPVVFNDDKRHTAHIAFDKTKTKIYYTLCDYATFTEIQCELYYRTVNEGGEFGEPVKLPGHINLPGCTTTEPNVGFDETTGKEWLFFVSDRKKGKGGLDIWASHINEDGSFSQPFNLPVNTPKNDVTPFFRSNSQTLYFSSEGYDGLGGYDIFKVAITNGNWAKPEHMPVPLNSSYNDTHFVLHESDTGGYLSSNRIGSTLLEPKYEACCNDIYAFDIHVIDLNAYTFNLKDSEALPGVEIQIFEIDQDGEVLVANRINDEGNDFNFELKRERKYALLATKDGFMPLHEEIDLTNPEMTQNRILKREFYLVPNTVDLDVLVFNNRSMRPLPGVEVRVALNGQEVDFQKNDEGNDVHFSLEKGKVYQLIGTLVAFISDTVIIDLRDVNNLMEMEETLLLQPKEIQEFLPVLLYFDNDMPDPRRRRPTTHKSYEDTYHEYMTRRDVFIEKYTKVLAGRDSTTAGRRIRAFFDRELQNGFISLMVFTENIKDALEEGSKIRLEIQGYTSPRAEEDYNELLSRRRANCLRNHFLRYERGILKSYLDSGQLSIVEVGYGEKFAPQFISDRLDDERESIYSLAASSERKVAIVGIRVDQEN